MAIFFTCWAYELTIVINVLVIWYSFDCKIDEKKGWLAVLHILIEITTMANVVVVLIYWLVIHQKAMEAFAGDQVKIVHMHLCHTFPAISNLIILYTTDVQLVPSHWKTLVLISFIYCAINYYVTLARGKPLYHFLDWKDYKSPLICVGMSVFFSGLYILLAKLSIRMNQRKKMKAVDYKRSD